MRHKLLMTAAVATTATLSLSGCASRTDANQSAGAGSTAPTSAASDSQSQSTTQQQGGQPVTQDAHIPSAVLLKMLPAAADLDAKATVDQTPTGSDDQAKINARKVFVDNLKCEPIADAGGGAWPVGTEAYAMTSLVHGDYRVTIRLSSAKLQDVQDAVTSVTDMTDTCVGDAAYHVLGDSEGNTKVRIGSLDDPHFGDQSARVKFQKLGTKGKYLPATFTAVRIGTIDMFVEEDGTGPADLVPKAIDLVKAQLQK